MFVRKSMMLFACAALCVAACENKDTTKTESNPGATSTPPEQPVTITNAPVAPQQPATTPAPVNPIANASNASEITQFPDQQKVAPSQAKVVTVAATVRPAPQSSDKVQVVKQGQEVTQLATDKDYFLVLFNDPSDTSKQKAGWVHRDALQSYAIEQKNDKTGKEPQAGPAAAKTAPAAAKLTCNTGEVRIQTDKDFCAHQCKEDADCKKLNGVCDGSGKMVSLSGQMTPAHYCVTSSVPGSETNRNETNEPSTRTPSGNTPSPNTPSKTPSTTPKP